MRMLLALTTLFIMSCASAPKLQSGKAYEPDQVLSRIDEMSSRPAWLHESESFKVEKGTVYSLGATTIPGDDRVEAAYRIAENNAKAAIASGIEQRLEFIFQNAEEGTKIGADQTRFIGSEVSSIVGNSIRADKRYWEKYSTTLENGERAIRYRVFSQVSMPESEFKAAVINALHKREGKAGISREFAKKVDKQWDKLVGERSPSNEE